MATALLKNEGTPADVYQRALDDCERKFNDRLRRLPEEAASDLKELFQLLQRAEADDDDDAREEIAQAIREILFPDSLKVDLTKKFFEEDPQARARLDSYSAKVGGEIRKHREALKMTQEQLATKAGLPQSHVSRLECGKHVPTFTTMEKIAAALDTTPSQLDPGFDD